MVRRSLMPAAVSLVVVAVIGLRAAAQVETIYRFEAGPMRASPASALTQAPDGSLCGAAEYGGNENVGQLYCVTTAGSLAVFYSFTKAQGPSSSSRLVVGADGSVYGTTRARDDHELGPGVPPGRTGTPFGSIFRISAEGQYQTVYTFSGGGDGGYPANALVLANDGTLYGTTNARLGKSVIFKATPGGLVSVLHEFTWVTDGAPNALIQGSDGDLYGTTATGGLGLNAGTIFKVSPTGTFALLHIFQKSQANEGAGPVGLIEGRDRNFYGTTLQGGASFGTVFKLTPSGGFSTMHSFYGGDGAFPGGGVVEGVNGDLYGTTNAGGTSGYGTIFKLTTSGQFKSLQTMSEPGTFFPLIVGRDGMLYGARAATPNTPSGGIVFRVVPD